MKQPRDAEYSRVTGESDAGLMTLVQSVCIRKVDTTMMKAELNLLSVTLFCQLCEHDSSSGICISVHCFWSCLGHVKNDE